MKKIVVILFVMLFASFGLLSAEDGRSGYAAAYLKLNLSARVVGMGGAFTAVADDALGLYYNPAGGPLINMNKVSASYRVMDFDRKMGHVAALFNAREDATVGVAWIYAGDNNWIARDEEGAPTGQDLTYADHNIALAFAKRFGEFIMIGATGKYFITKVGTINSTSVGFDVGSMVSFNRENWFDENSFFNDIRVGLAVQNLGTNWRWTTGDYWGEQGESGVSLEEKAQVFVRGGISALAFDSTALVALDLVKGQDQDVRIHAGAEYTAAKLFTVRGGYADGRFTLGGGVYKKFVYYALRFDYAFASDREGESPDHLFTIGFEFR